MKWLCKLGLHRWLPVFVYYEAEDAWLFGPLQATGEFCCTRCRKRVTEDVSPPAGDYD